MHLFHEALRQVVGPLLVDFPDRDIMACGTCFIIAAMGEIAIGVTATHVLEYATAQDVPSRVTSHASSMFKFDECNKVWQKIKILAHIQHEHRPFFMSYSLEAHEAYSRPDVDISFLLLRAEQESDLPIEKKINLLSEPPHVGDRVLVVGYFDTDARASHKIADDGGAVFVSVESKFNCIEAKVTDVYPVGVRHLRFPCFQIDAPLYSGMSGGCVLKEKDGEWLACGVISSDMNFGDAASGEHALAAQIWPALFTSMGETKKYSYQNEKGETIEAELKVIYDLIEAGAIIDHSKAIEHVSQSDPKEGQFPLKWL